MDDLMVRRWEETNQPGVPKLWAAGKRLYLREAAIEHNAVVDALASLTAECDRYKAALEFTLENISHTAPHIRNRVVEVIEEALSPTPPKEP